MNIEFIEDYKEDKTIKKKKRKKRKNNKVKLRKPLLIIVIIILVSSLTAGGYILYNNILTNNIKNNYSEFVKTIKSTNIYDKNNNKIGTITKNITLELNSIKNIDQNDKYFSIKDTNYKVYYKDVKK